MREKVTGKGIEKRKNSTNHISAIKGWSYY